MMPSMSPPQVSKNSKEFSNIQMKRNPTPPQESGKVDFDNMSDKEKKQFYNNLTGYKEKNKLFLDKKKHNVMGKDSFMKLFVAQLKNQDPSKPMDQSKMTAELAQFSQLEQMTNLNKKFDSLTKSAHLEKKFFGASFLGKEVISRGNSIVLDEESSGADVHYSLDSDAKKVSVQILDQKGNILKQFWKDGVSQGNHQLHWDGDQEDGAPSPQGQYAVRVMAWDKGNELIPASVMNKGLVTAVHMEGSEPILVVNGKQVALRDVESFKMKKEKKSVKKSVVNSAMLPKKNQHNVNTQAELDLRQQAIKNAKANTQLNQMRDNYHER